MKTHEVLLIWGDLTLHDHKTSRGQKEIICKIKKLFRTVVKGGLQVGQEVTRRKCTVKPHDNLFYLFVPLNFYALYHL